MDDFDDEEQSGKKCSECKFIRPHSDFLGLNDRVLLTCISCRTRHLKKHKDANVLEWRPCCICHKPFEVLKNSIKNYCGESCRTVKRAQAIKRKKRHQPLSECPYASGALTSDPCHTGGM